MPQLAVRNRYDQQSQQLGQDIAGTISGAYEGYQKGKERQETSRLRGIQTQSAEMTLEQQMRKIEEAKTSKKAFETLKKGAMDEIRAGMQNQASMARGEKILKMYDSIQFEGGKGVDKLAKYTATKQELDDFSKKSKDEKLGLGDYPVEYISAGSGLFQKSYEKAKQSALGKKQVSAMKDAKTKGEATQAGVGEGEEPLTPQAKEMAGAKPAEMTAYQKAQLKRQEDRDEIDKAKGQRDMFLLRDKHRDNATALESKLVPANKALATAEKAKDELAESIAPMAPEVKKEQEAKAQAAIDAAMAEVTRIKQDINAEKDMMKYAETMLKEDEKVAGTMRRIGRQRGAQEYAALPTAEKERKMKEYEASQQPQLATRTRGGAAPAPTTTKPRFTVKSVRQAGM